MKFHSSYSSCAFWLSRVLRRKCDFVADRSVGLCGHSGKQREKDNLNLLQLITS